MLPGSERHDEQHNLDVWREQVEEDHNPRGEERGFYGRPDRAYANALEYVFFYYRENASEAERDTAEG